jgi:hypothetical protein
MPFNRPDEKEETLHLVSQEDAYRIDGLISTLAMAISEILEMRKVIVPPFPEYPEDPELACQMLADDASRIHQEHMEQLDQADRDTQPEFDF